MYQLAEPSMNLERSYNDYTDEWEKAGENIIPTAAKREGKPFKQLVQEWGVQKTDRMYEQGWVPASLYFLIDENKKIFGALQIRHALNEKLLKLGGHIGYGVRPSERQKGLATKMLSLSLKKAEELGLKRVLITCDKKNIGSAKTITNNGGVLENEEDDGNRITQRYWVQI